MLKCTLIASIITAAVLAAAATPAAAASCGNGYEPVKVQGNWVCRLRTPKLPLKAKTQSKGSFGHTLGFRHEHTRP